MIDVEPFRKIFQESLWALLQNWSTWCDDDELRALHIGFDSSNTEISISLLTDREPHLAEQGIDPFQQRIPPWAVGDWRLNRINATYRHGWPDAALLLDWMEENSRTLEDSEIDKMNADLKKMFFEVATEKETQRILAHFKRTATPLRIRVAWFFDDVPFDSQLHFFAKDKNAR